MSSNILSLAFFAAPGVCLYGLSCAQKQVENYFYKHFGPAMEYSLNKEVDEHGFVDVGFTGHDKNTLLNLDFKKGVYYTDTDVSTAATYAKLNSKGKSKVPCIGVLASKGEVMHGPQRFEGPFAPAVERTKGSLKISRIIPLTEDTDPRFMACVGRAIRQTSFPNNQLSFNPESHLDSLCHFNS